MFLAWIWELLGGGVKYDRRNNLIRFFIFDLYVWILLAYGIHMLLLGKLD